MNLFGWTIFESEPALTSSSSEPTMNIDGSLMPNGIAGADVFGCPYGVSHDSLSGSWSSSSTFDSSSSFSSSSFDSSSTFDSSSSFGSFGSSSDPFSW